MERDLRERKQRSEGKSEAVVSSVFVETYQSERLPHGSVFLAFLRLSLLCPPYFVRLSALSLVASSLSSLYLTTMKSDSPLSPADATRSLVTNGKIQRMTKGKAFGSPTKNLAKRVGGISKETSAAIPPNTKHKTPQGQKLVGQRLASNNNNVVTPEEANSTPSGPG
jgi:hypothetical protein